MAHKILVSLLVALSLASGAIGTATHTQVQHHVAKRTSGQECFKNFAKDPQQCPIVYVSFFVDEGCSKPLNLGGTASSFKRGNTEMLFEGAISKIGAGQIGSVKILGAAAGIGIGFAREEESDTVIQNMAWMSSAAIMQAYRSKSCVTFPNLDRKNALYWTTKAEDSLNKQGYVWNPDNVPVTQNLRACNMRLRKRIGTATRQSGSQQVCLDEASWGGGAVLHFFDNDNCQGGRFVRQLYNTAQCTPLSMTQFKSFRAVQPKGDTIPIVFSSVYYDRNAQTGYHSCDIKNTMTIPFLPDQCQKVAGNGKYVGIFGNDPSYPQPPPGVHDKVLKKSR